MKSAQCVASRIHSYRCQYFHNGINVPPFVRGVPANTHTLQLVNCNFTSETKLTFAVVKVDHNETQCELTDYLIITRAVERLIFLIALIARLIILITR